MARRKLGEMLLEAGVISEFELNTALSDQRQWRRPLGVTVVRLGFVSEAEMIRVLSEQLRLPVVDLQDKVAPPEAVDLVPHDIATKHGCLPLAVRYQGKSRELYVAMSDPTSLEAVDAIAFRAGHEIRSVVAAHEQIEVAIERSYRPDVRARFEAVKLEDILASGGSAAGSRPEPSPPPPAVEKKERTKRAAPRKASAPKPAGTSLEAIAGQSSAAQGRILQDLIQLMVAKRLIDADELARLLASAASESQS